MEERIDHVLRVGLASRPRPEAGPTFTADVLRAVALRARPSEPRRGLGGRLLLSGYWLAVGVAGISLLGTQGRPSWVDSTLWGLAFLLVPFSYAALLWPRRLRAWVVLLLHPLLAGPRGLASSR